MANQINVEVIKGEARKDDEGNVTRAASYYTRVSAGRAHVNVGSEGRLAILNAYASDSKLQERVKTAVAHAAKLNATVPVEERKTTTTTAKRNAVKSF